MRFFGVGGLEIAIRITEDSLVDFTKDSFRSSANTAHDVDRIGSGSAVIVIHEIPRITPVAAAFARRVAERGMTAVLPDLLGAPGRPMTIPYSLNSLARACVSKEFTLLALNKTSPTVNYLRDLANHEHEAHGGPGVGAPLSSRASLPIDSAESHFF